jgi:Cohesin loading factor
MENNKAPLKVEMQVRLHLAEILIDETENLDIAEDLLSKGVYSYLLGS